MLEVGCQTEDYRSHPRSNTKARRAQRAALTLWPPTPLGRITERLLFVFIKIGEVRRNHRRSRDRRSLPRITRKHADAAWSWNPAL